MPIPDQTQGSCASPLSEKRKTRRRALAGLLFSLLVILLIGQQLDAQNLLALLQGTDTQWLSAALVLFFANYVLRAYRFRSLTLTTVPPFSQIYGITALHGALNYLLPAKLGELAYPFLARLHIGLSTSEGAAGLIIARSWDFAIVAILLPMIGVFFSARLPEWAPPMLVGFSAVILTGITTTTWLAFRENKRPKSESRILAMFKKISSNFRGIHRRGGHIKLGLLSAFIWVCIYGNFYCLARALGLETSLLEMAVVSTLLLPMSLLPIQGLANVGTHELAWVSALGLFGHNMERAFEVAVGTHILLLLFVLILGLSGMICLHLSRQN